MTNLFIKYEIAKQLKELGFNEKCLAFYYNYNNHIDNINKDSKKLEFSQCEWGDIKNTEELAIDYNNLNSSYYAIDNFISAPLYQQVTDWFRENHKIHIGIFTRSNFGSIHYLITEMGVDGNVLNTSNKNNDLNIDYYKLLDNAIEETLKLLKP